jgi:alpha-mannosidase
LADQGGHRFTYSLLPGATVADAIAEGYALNLPLRVTPGGADAAERAPLVRVTGDDATIEAVKLADDESGDVVVRLYESLGGRAKAVLHAAFPIAQAQIVDLLERPTGQTAGESLPVGADGSIPLALRPFQILTLRLTRA